MAKLVMYQLASQVMELVLYTSKWFINVFIIIVCVVIVTDLRCVCRIGQLSGDVQVKAFHHITLFVTNFDLQIVGFIFNISFKLDSVKKAVLLLLTEIQLTFFNRKKPKKNLLNHFE